MTVPGGHSLRDGERGCTVTDDLMFLLVESLRWKDLAGSGSPSLSDDSSPVAETGLLETAASLVAIGLGRLWLASSGPRASSSNKGKAWLSSTWPTAWPLRLGHGEISTALDETNDQPTNNM